jgi:succinyl-diaminopimelate desuccinylase
MPKGPLIAMVEAMRLLIAERSSWSGTILGVFVADEEVASEGAKRYASTRPHIDYAVIGEPTSNGTVIAHKGSLRPIVRIHGVSAHSGMPDLGENAVYQAARLIGVVEEHHRTVVRHRTHPLVGQASLTVTRANAGIADNVVPDRCDVMLDRRMVPG